MAAIGLLAVITFVFLSAVFINKLLFKENKLELAPIGNYSTQFNNYDLRQYFVDKFGNLYSANLDTWELNLKEGRDLLKCSDNSLVEGEIVNSMRDVHSKKATVKRNRLKFNVLAKKNGTVIVSGIKITDRHLKVHSLIDRRNPEGSATILNDSMRYRNV